MARACKSKTRERKPEFTILSAFTTWLENVKRHDPSCVADQCRNLGSQPYNATFSLCYKKSETTEAYQLNTIPLATKSRSLSPHISRRDLTLLFSRRQNNPDKTGKQNQFLSQNISTRRRVAASRTKFKPSIKADPPNLITNTKTHPGQHC